MAVVIFMYLIASDLDGTLLNSHKKLSEDTKNYIKKIAKNNIFIIATSRCYFDCLDIYNELELTTPIICNSGAFIYSYNNDSLIRLRNSIDNDAFKDIFSHFKKDIINTIFHVNNDIYMYKLDSRYNFFFYIKEETQFHELDFENAHFPQPISIHIFIKPEILEDFRVYIAKNHQNINPIFIGADKTMAILELRLNQSTKGNALKKVIEYFNIDLENTIAFGDGDVDLDMLYAVKKGFLMKNSFINDSILPKTEFDNDEDGVIKELQKLLNKN